MKFGVFALTSLLLAFARPASAEDCHLLYRGGIPADSQEPRLPSPLPCRPGPATNDLDRIWIDTSGGFTPDPTRVDLVVQAVNAARGLFRVPASGVGGIDLLLSSGHDTRYGRSGDPRFGSVHRDDHTRCLVVLNRNTERLSAPHLQQYVAKAVSACAFRDYFHPEQAAWFARVGNNPALAWWTQTLSTYMSAAVYPTHGWELRYRERSTWFPMTPFWQQQDSAPLAFFEALRAEPGVTPADIGDFIRAIDPARPDAMREIFARFLGRRAPHLMRNLSQRLVDGIVAARGGESLPIQTDPPQVSEIGENPGTYIVGEVDSLTFKYNKYRVPSAMELRVQSAIPDGLQVFWRSPGNKVWRNLPEDITWSTPCTSGSSFELLAVAQLHDATVKTRSFEFTVTPVGAPQRCECDARIQDPCVAKPDWKLDPAVLKELYVQLAATGLRLHGITGDLLASFTTPNVGVLRAVRWTHTTSGVVSDMPMKVEITLDGSGDYTVGTSPHVGDGGKMCLRQSRANMTSAASVEIAGQRSDIPVPAPSQSMLPSGTTPVLYTCNEHELTFDLWQEVLPGQMVRIPYRFTR